MKNPLSIASLLLCCAAQAQSALPSTVTSDILARAYNDDSGSPQLIGEGDWLSGHELFYDGARVSHLDLRVGVPGTERVLLFVHCAPTTETGEVDMVNAWESVYPYLAIPSGSVLGSALQLNGTLNSGATENLVIPAARVEAHVQEFLATGGANPSSFGPLGTNAWLDHASGLLSPSGDGDERHALMISTTNGLLDLDDLGREAARQIVKHWVPGLVDDVRDAAAEWLVDEIGVDIYLQALTIDTTVANDTKYRLTRKYRARRRSLKQETSDQLYAMQDGLTTNPFDGALRHMVAPVFGEPVRYVHIGGYDGFLRVHFPAGVTVSGLVGTLVTLSGNGVFLRDPVLLGTVGDVDVVEFPLTVRVDDPDGRDLFDSGSLLFMDSGGSQVVPLHGDPLNYHMLTVFAINLPD